MGTDLSWGTVHCPEQRKNMGTFTSDTSFPRDSAIHWCGSGMCTSRILEGHKKNNSKKGGPKVKCLWITKRERWIEHLHKKKEQTRARVFDESNKRKMATVKCSQAEAKERIAATITNPNKSWSSQKKEDKCAMPQNFFGQHA